MTGCWGWEEDWGFLARGTKIKGMGPADIRKQIDDKLAEEEALRARVVARAKGGRWQQTSNTIGNARWNEDTVISNAIWKTNSLAHDKYIMPTDPCTLAASSTKNSDTILSPPPSGA